MQLVLSARAYLLMTAFILESEGSCPDSAGPSRPRNKSTEFFNLSISRSYCNGNKLVN